MKRTKRMTPSQKLIAGLELRLKKSALAHAETNNAYQLCLDELSHLKATCAAMSRTYVAVEAELVKAKLDLDIARYERDEHEKKITNLQIYRVRILNQTTNILQVIIAAASSVSAVAQEMEKRLSPETILLDIDRWSGRPGATVSIPVIGMPMVVSETRKQDERGNNV